MKRILIIEDEEGLRESTKSLLESSNYEVVTACDGAEGVLVAGEIIPDLIICDILMPKMNGYKVIETLRNKKGLADIPFIFLSAMGDMSDIRSGMDFGADDYLVKPFRSAELLKAVEARLKRFEHGASRETNEVTEPEPNTKKALTENDRLFLKVNDKPQIIRVGDIVSIKAEGEYSTISLVSGTKVLVRRLMKEWEEQLPENLFLRVHRSAIVNLNQIDRIEKWYKRSYAIVLKNSGDRFVISQRYLSKVKARFMS